MLDYQLIDLLRNVHFLREVDEDDLQALGAILELVEYDQGEEIIRQGTRADALYFIDRGEVDIIQKPAEGVERRLATLEPGDTFGEMELVFRQPRTATVRATQPTTIYRWNRAAVSKFMQATRRHWLI